MNQTGERKRREGMGAKMREMREETEERREGRKENGGEGRGEREDKPGS